MTHLPAGHAILGHAPRSSAFAEERIEMSMPSSANQWTLEDLERLPDDGNKYEVVHGELFVTPAPGQPHEIVSARLTRLLDPYVAEHGLGLVFRPRAVVRSVDSEVEPDLMIRAQGEASPNRWQDAPTPILVVEVISPTTRRRDHMQKRDFYEEIGVPEYWIADIDERSVRVARPNRDDSVATETLVWTPRADLPPLVISLVELFAGLRTGDA
jgi:Uma2 family endonuclease